MSAIGTYRLVNALENGSYSGGTLETALGTTRTHDEFKAAFLQNGYAKRLGTSESAAKACLGSAKGVVEFCNSRVALEALQDNVDTATAVSLDATAIANLFAADKGYYVLTTAPWIAKSNASSYVANHVFVNAASTMIDNGSVNLRRTTDYTTWASVTAADSGSGGVVTGIAGYGTTVYASGSTANYGISVYRSTDSGASFSSIIDGDLQYSPLKSIACKSANEAAAVVSTAGTTNQVKYTTNGTAWSNLTPTGTSSAGNGKFIYEPEIDLWIAPTTIGFYYGYGSPANITNSVPIASFVAAFAVGAKRIVCFPDTANTMYSAPYNTTLSAGNFASSSVLDNNIIPGANGLKFGTGAYGGGVAIACVRADAANTRIKLIATQDGVTWIPIYIPALGANFASDICWDGSKFTIGNTGTTTTPVHVSNA